MPSATFPARFEFLDELRKFVAEFARENGFAEKEIYSLQLAADEAASNIIEHAYADVSNAEFDVTCDMRGGALTIVMRDSGKSFDASKVKQPDLKANLGRRQVGGLGVYLMRKLMDEVHYEPNAKTGNVLTMIKRRE
ncbi:MAG: ATP-binding protein [Anaerolineales bacterium]|nr:ATP-binding protein [Anaerolineales bacterium]